MAPRISVVTPVFDPPLGAFLACVRSVLGQTEGDWEWCLVDDRSTRPEVIAALDDLAATDPRVRVARREVNGGIVAASNDALAMATGEFVALLDHDDALVPTALAEALRVLDGPVGAEVDYLYTDEAHTLADGREAAHFLKPDWSPERFRSSMYTCHLSVLRRSLVDEIGGFRTGFDGSQDHDLILRATEVIAARGRRVVHVPRLTYHWRNVASSVSRATSTVSRAVDNGRRAVQEQCDRLGIDAEVVHGPVAGCYRVVRRLAPSTRTTIAVATRLEPASCRPYAFALEATLRSVAVDHPGARLVVAHATDVPAELLALLDDAVAGTAWQPLPVPGPWSVASAIDLAFERYPCDVLVSVAPGLVARTDATPDWLGAMAGLALSPGAGLVGALVADRLDTVLHAGWDVPNYRWYELEGLPVGQTTSGNDLLIERECSHVSLAAAAIGARAWREGRASATGRWHDAGRALSAALVATGRRTLWTPWARFDQHTPIPL